jgi:hypothetical protein
LLPVSGMSIQTSLLHVLSERECDISSE